jgi:hypothetical protein
MNLSTRVRTLEAAAADAFVRSLSDEALLDAVAILDVLEAGERLLTADEQARYAAIMAPLEGRR